MLAQEVVRTVLYEGLLSIITSFKKSTFPNTSKLIRVRKKMFRDDSEFFSTGIRSPVFHSSRSLLLWQTPFNWEGENKRIRHSRWI